MCTHLTFNTTRSYFFNSQLECCRVPSNWSSYSRRLKISSSPSPRPSESNKAKKLSNSGSTGASCPPPPPLSSSNHWDKRGNTAQRLWYRKSVAYCRRYLRNRATAISTVQAISMVQQNPHLPLLATCPNQPLVNSDCVSLRKGFLVLNSYSKRAISGNMGFLKPLTDRFENRVHHWCSQLGGLQWKL